MKRLQGHDEVGASLRLLARLLGARGAWFLREVRGGRAVELLRCEWELRAAGGSVVFSYGAE